MARLSRTNSATEHGVGSSQCRMRLCEEEEAKWRSPLLLPLPPAPHTALFSLKKVGTVW